MRKSWKILHYYVTHLTETSKYIRENIDKCKLDYHTKCQHILRKNSIPFLILLGPAVYDKTIKVNLKWVPISHK